MRCSLEPRSVYCRSNFLSCKTSKLLLRYLRRLQGSSSSWQSALEIVTGDDPLGPYLCHIQAENLAYTLIRSIIFVKPDQINEVFNFIHSLEHLESKQKSRLKKQDHPILSYWQEKAAICGGCTVSAFDH